jgi:hypothetical protein
VSQGYFPVVADGINKKIIKREKTDNGKKDEEAHID